MTQYYTDFSEYSTQSSLPSTWAEFHINTGGSDAWAIESDSNATGGQKLTLDVGGSSGLYGARWDDIGSADDMEVAVLTRFDSLTGYNEIYGCTRVDSGDDDNYAAGHNDDSGDFEVRYLDGSTATVLANETSAYTAGTWWWIRFRANGDDLKARYWQKGDSEPDTWDLTTTDSTLSPGYAGVSANLVYFESVKAEFDRFGVGTSGDSAPLSAGSAPNAPSDLSATLSD